MRSEKTLLLQKMKSKIDQIENLSYELKKLGPGIPVIEKNVQGLLNTVYVLKCGISDVAETTNV